MGRLTDDTTRLVGEILAARDERGRLTRDLKDWTAAMKRAVARLRGTFAADIAGAQAAWFGTRAPVTREAGEPGPAAPGGWEAEAEHEDVLPEATEGRGRREAERRARDEVRVVRKARGRHRLR